MLADGWGAGGAAAAGRSVGGLPVARDQQDGRGSGRTCSRRRDQGPAAPAAAVVLIILMAAALLAVWHAVDGAAAAALGRARRRPAAVQSQGYTCVCIGIM